MTVKAASPAGARDPGVVPDGGPARILLVSGSTRAGSTNTPEVLRAVLDHVSAG
jgi:hypothetical protein